MTELKNRRAFDIEYERLTESYLEQNDKEHHGHLLAILDVDFFKLVNDNHGHIVGDETLISISNIMKEFFMREDHLYRFGGEEFIILMHNTRLESAANILEALRVLISKYNFPQVGKKTVSIGFVEIQKGIDNSLLFDRADSALYYAKHSGRNCVKNYETLVFNNNIQAVISKNGNVEIF